MLDFKDMRRRKFLRIGALGLGGLSLANLLKARESGARRATAKACILLYMDGGPSHIDLWDLKPQAAAEIRGPFKPIPTTVPGLQISELLPLTAQQMHYVMLVRSMWHAETVHDPAVYQMLTGRKHVSSAGGLKVEETDFPQMGTAFGYVDPTRAVMPKVVQLPATMKMEARVLPGQNAGFLGLEYDPFQVEVSPAAEVPKPHFEPEREFLNGRLSDRASLLQEFNRRLCRLDATDETQHFDLYQRQALEILAQPQIHEAFELSRELATTRERYGRNRHGQSVLLARRLVEAGARFVTVYWGSEDQDWADGRGMRPANNPWDTHRNHFPLVKNSLAPRADQALAALLEDLAQRGTLGDTLVIWMGDFGRTPRIDRQYASRDHWPHAFSVLLAGGGISGGGVFGGTDRLAGQVASDPVTPADLTATVFDALGVDPKRTIRGPQNSRLPISTGRVISQWFG